MSAGGTTTTTANPSPLAVTATKRKAVRNAPGRALTCPDARRGLEYWKDVYARHRAVQGLTAPPDTVRYDCESTARRASEWRDRAIIERYARELWEEQLTDGDWEHAISEAQGPYPGTDGWLLSCSLSEGYARGRDRWVSNHDGSGAGGPMQFMESTFWRMWSAARDDLASRGIDVPDEAASWYSNLGQALAAAWGMSHGRAHEWSGSGC